MAERDGEARTRAATFRLDLDILDGLDTVKQRDGIPHSEQVRRALRAWLRDRKALPKNTTGRRGTP